MFTDVNRLKIEHLIQLLTYYNSIIIYKKNNSIKNKINNL